MKRYLLLIVALSASLGIVWETPCRAAESEGQGAAFVRPGVPHPGSDQIFWVPTFAQAEDVARHTGRMILVMGSVGDWNGY